MSDHNCKSKQIEAVHEVAFWVSILQDGETYVLDHNPITNPEQLQSVCCFDEPLLLDRNPDSTDQHEEYPFVEIALKGTIDRNYEYKVNIITTTAATTSCFR